MIGKKVMIEEVAEIIIFSKGKMENKVFIEKVRKKTFRLSKFIQKFPNTQKPLLEHAFDTSAYSMTVICSFKYFIDKHLK